MTGNGIHMIRSSTLRLLGLAAAMAVVMSCDAGAPTGAGEYLNGNGGDTIVGGSGGNATTGGDGRFPVAVIDTPAVRGSLVNVGDSILVAVRMRDATSGVASLVIAGLSIRGDPEVGTQVITERYPSVKAPATGTFPAGTATRADTTVRRILRARLPVDSTADSLVIRAIVTDHSGLADTVYQVVRLVSGPRVVITAPIPGDSVRPGTRVGIKFHATHPDGVAEVRIRVVSETTWPTPVDSTFPVFTYTGNLREVLDSTSILVPADAPGRGRLTITAEAIDANRIPGAAAPVQIRIRASEAAVPLVRQTVPARAELNDSITISANGGNGIAQVGFIVRNYDGTGAEIKRDVLTLPGDASSVTVRMSMALPQSVQGGRVSITSYATDRSGRTGYSVPATANTPVETLPEAHRDTVLVVYGQTYALPRPGFVGDLAVNAANGHIFLSNTQYNRLEVWQAASATFHPTGVAVGAEPWGMTVSATNPNELLVANSGGTNISRVDITSPVVSSITESSRILTRNTFAYTVRETRDPETARIRIVVTGPFSYSDRPQYIAHSAGGRIYYSTRPTSIAPAGTLRFLDPAQPYPESRQVTSYGSPTAALNEYTIFDVDGVSAQAEPADSPLSDLLILCDHNSGTIDPAVCAGSRGGVAAAIDALRGTGVNTDVRAQAVSLPSLALTDTTFVAWSADRNWVAFGEGNSALGRVMMANDPAGTPLESIFFSPGLDVADLVDNANERVFGLALDSIGRGLAVHGAQSYFGSVERPFHLRMQGKFDTFDRGAGIAFHPRAKVDPAMPGARNDRTRLVFVASENGTIEIVDAFYFVSRGRVVVRNKLYGPLRASLPLTAAEVAAGVEVKLYGMTDRGLVVVDVTAADIKDVP